MYGFLHMEKVSYQCYLFFIFFIEDSFSSWISNTFPCDAKYLVESQNEIVHHSPKGSILLVTNH